MTDFSIWPTPIVWQRAEKFFPRALGVSQVGQTQIFVHLHLSVQLGRDISEGARLHFGLGPTRPRSNKKPRRAKRQQKERFRPEPGRLPPVASSHVRPRNPPPRLVQTTSDSSRTPPTKPSLPIPTEPWICYKPLLFK